MVHVSEVAVSLLEEIVTGVMSFDKGLLTGVEALFPSGVPLLVPATTGDSLVSDMLQLGREPSSLLQFNASG